MSFKRRIKRGDRIYYDEVENVRVNGKVVQKHLRYIGTNPDEPTNFPIDHVHFGYIAMRLMQGDLSANEILDMIEKMGHHVLRDDLEAVGIRYRFKKKDITVSLYYARKSRRRKDAENAGKN
ncbi:MAG: hypothetical protein LVQ96_07305 [Thermoplasmatales archaeon]|nr:hypothetical protein [Thermoplasmatales archaeon]